MAFKRHLVATALALIGMLLAAAAPARAEPLQIVAFGDSLMAGYGLSPGESFPERLETAMRARGHDVVIANAGVSGDTTSGGLARLDWSVPDGTNLVILELGANDMLRGVPTDITRKNLAEMIARLQSRGIGIILAGMRAAPNLGAEYQALFDAIFPDLAAEYGLPLYPFFLEGVAAQEQYLLGDGMHPNAAGIDVMVANFLPAIEAMLAVGSPKS
jgi:acyl-CoA thioesterase-1